MAWGGEFFSSDIMWWLGDWTRLILHQLPLPRKSLKRGKDILVSTSWWEVANHIRYGIRFTVRILATFATIELQKQAAADRYYHQLHPKPWAKSPEEAAWALMQRIMGLGQWDGSRSWFRWSSPPSMTKYRRPVDSPVQAFIVIPLSASAPVNAVPVNWLP